MLPWLALLLMHRLGPTRRARLACLTGCVGSMALVLPIYSHAALLSDDAMRAMAFVIVPIAQWVLTGFLVAAWFFCRFLDDRDAARKMTVSSRLESSTKL
jgi:hypothetical protein